MDITIIGGGAAGMMAAVAAKTEMLKKGFSGSVRLYEKNFLLGRKVLLSGGGRCNVTTGETDVKKVLLNYPRGADFLKTAMFDFGPAKVREWFMDHGVKMKEEADKRVFPVSDDGKDVVGALRKEMEQLGVEVFLKNNVLGLKKVKGGFELEVMDGKDAPAARQIFKTDVLILTTGGKAYCATGSTGDGYAFAKTLGHSTTALAPALNSFLLKEDVALLAGISFKRAGVKLDGKQVYERQGAFMFTHGGVTGPAVFALSSMAAYEKCGKNEPMKLLINFFPDDSSEKAERMLMDLINKHGGKSMINLIDMLLPKSLCKYVLLRSDIPGDLHAGRLSREQRKRLLTALTAMEFTVTGRAAGEEFVTAGGVELSEVDKKTMQSKLVSGLFFAGEILDIDGFTGGFNLQAAWATGRLAGISACRH
jgi:predicted Rossmann fold flavoprotein